MARSSSFVDVAVIGAGPYGLSLAAHLGARGVEYRIFGETMRSWKSNMPPGMLLKSYPWASCLSDPSSEFSVKSFCTERALPYHDVMMPLPLDRFIQYGEAFQARYVPAGARRRRLPRHLRRWRDGPGAPGGDRSRSASLQASAAGGRAFALRTVFA
jgi:cation diffusion facilitator CzcD-associated flavoprotein CzcO